MFDIAMFTEEDGCCVSYIVVLKTYDRVAIVSCIS